jgi:predicted nucleic acid-binding protein
MSKINYAWDSTVAIAWLRDEEGAPLADIAEVVREIDDGKANLIFSVTTFTEILASKFSENQRNQLEKLLLRSNVLKADTTFRIAQAAATIRDAGLKEKRKIRTPDATILAVAVLFKVNALHTLDSDMLTLNGSSIASGLRITKPYPFSGPLFSAQS